MTEPKPQKKAEPKKATAKPIRAGGHVLTERGWVIDKTK